MKVTVLGCSGGIAGTHLRTTSLLVDDDILIDAGTGVGDLDLAQLARIDHVFLTHSHLDHIACLPLMIDTVSDIRTTPLVVHATMATLEILRQHIFNWAIWPDFTRIPDETRPLLRFEPVMVGQWQELAGRRIGVLPARHTVPAVGYALDSGDACLAFTGDTTACDELWQAINALPNLRHLIIETAFSDGQAWLARASMHLCPGMLATELEKLVSSPKLHITHLKPGQSEATMTQLLALAGRLKPHMLQSGEVLVF